MRPAEIERDPNSRKLGERLGAGQDGERGRVEQLAFTEVKRGSGLERAGNRIVGAAF